MALKACSQYQALGTHTPYNYHTAVLPLNTVEITTLPSISVKKEIKKSRKRIITFDLYDSEASNDGFLDSPEESSQTPAGEEDTKPSVESESDKQYMNISLKTFYEFYDTMSSVDVLETADNNVRSDTLTDEIMMGTICSNDIQCFGLRKMCRSFQNVKDHVSGSETICIPKLKLGSKNSFSDSALVIGEERYVIC